MTALIAVYTGDGCAETWLEKARADGPDISHAELTIGALHEPLFRCGSGAAAVQGSNRHAVRETLAC